MLDYSRDGRATNCVVQRDRVGYRRIIHERIPLERIDVCDADFYRENQSRSCYYVSLQGEREAYFRDNPCTVMLFNCMDGRERDAARALGIPPGSENIYATAGNKIGDVNLVLCKDIQARIDRAAAADKRVLILFTTHESWSKRDTDSCAAWGNQGQLAAVQPVEVGHQLRVAEVALTAVGGHRAEDLANRVDHGEQPRRDLGGDHEVAVTELGEQVLTHVSDRLQRTEPQEAGGALDRVDRAEDPPDHIGILSLLEVDELLIELVEVLVTLRDELVHHFVEFAIVHY